jgi:hypothetical protein
MVTFVQADTRRARHLVWLFSFVSSLMLWFGKNQTASTHFRPEPIAPAGFEVAASGIAVAGASPVVDRVGDVVLVDGVGEGVVVAEVAKNRLILSMSPYNSRFKGIRSDSRLFSQLSKFFNLGSPSVCIQGNQP